MVELKKDMDKPVLTNPEYWLINKDDDRLDQTTLRNRKI